MGLLAQEVMPDEIRVDYTCLKKDLPSVIVDLSKKSDINISFDPNTLPSNKQVSLNATNQPVGAILNAILKGTGSKYKIIGNQIAITKDEFLEAEEIITISGYLRDSLSGEPLVFASIYTQEKFEGTESNENGFYSFSIDKGIQRVYYSYLGYNKTILELKLKKDTTVNVLLSPDAQLNEVLILDSNVDAIEPELFSGDNLPVDRIWSISSLAGESDVYGLVQMMSGVSTGADGFGGFNVRGGSYDQNLVILDGVPVYNSSHALGVFSIFNPNTIKSAKLLKGSFPARYGGRLSSVLDIRTREGSNKKVKGDISFGSIAFKTSLEGPLGKNGSSFMISARRTHLDLWLLKNISEFIYEISALTGRTDYHFGDFNAKINLMLGEKHKLNFSYYGGNDVLENNVARVSMFDGITTTETNVLDSEWGNRLLSIKLNSELSQKMYHNLTFYSSRFGLNNFDLQQFNTTTASTNSRTYTAGLFSSTINDLGVKSDFDYIPNSKNYIKFGLGYVRHDFNPGILGADHRDNLITGTIDRDTLSDILQTDEISGSEIYAYVEDEIRFSKDLRANVGLRYNLVKTESNSNHMFEPRLSLLYQNDNFHIKAGLSRMNQYLHLLSNGGFGLPTDVWLPSTDVLKPERSWVYNLGVGFKLSESVDVEIEGFYKNLDRVVSFSEGQLTDIGLTSEWQSVLPIGSGKASGIELNINKRYGNANIFANYTLSRSDRVFNNINEGEEFLFRFDRTHQLKFSYIQKINKNAEFSANWQWLTGSPVSLPKSVVTVFIDGNWVPIITFEGINLDRLPSYHRLDLGFNFYNTYSWAKQKFSIGVYNAYNKRNPFYIDVGTDNIIPTDFRTYQYSILPILPYVSYSLSF